MGFIIVYLRKENVTCVTKTEFKRTNKISIKIQNIEASRLETDNTVGWIFEDLLVVRLEWQRKTDIFAQLSIQGVPGILMTMDRGVGKVILLRADMDF